MEDGEEVDEYTNIFSGITYSIIPKECIISIEDNVNKISQMRKGKQIKKFVASGNRIQAMIADL